MISNITIHDKDNVPLEWWAKKEQLVKITSLTFKPGLNILWGKNGAGKSSVLTLLARMFHAEQGRWSTVTRESLLTIFQPIKKLSGMPLLIHDGQGIAHYNPNHKVGLIGGMAGFDDDFYEQGIQAIFNMKNSSGEIGLNEIGKLFADINARKSLLPVWKLKTSGNGVWKKRLAATESFFKPSQDLGQVTILLDEPDRSLDIPAQAQLWRKIFPHLAKKFQLIIATHSPFAANVEANYIEISENYLDECRSVIG